MLYLVEPTLKCCLEKEVCGPSGQIIAFDNENSRRFFLGLALFSVNNLLAFLEGDCNQSFSIFDS